MSEQLDKALRAALRNWQLETGHTTQYWLRGYCLDFAETLAEIVGEPASLGSVLANDGNVHHIVVAIADLVIDARGVSTKDQLLAQIGAEAQASNCPIRPVGIVPFKPEHGRLLKASTASHIRSLRTSLNSSGLRDICR